MLCPKCKAEVINHDIDIIQGFKVATGKVEILAEGDLRIYFCPGCKIAILSDRPKEEPKPTIIIPC